jgi:outer membrane receptor protein involved in Fe transport
LETALPPASLQNQARVEAFDPFHNYIVIGKVRFQPSESAVTEVIANFAHREYTFEQSAPAPASTHMERDWEYGARLTQSIELSDANTLRVSGLFNHWECPTGKRYFWPRPADLWTYMAGIVDEQVIGRWTLNAGYRLNQTYYDEFGGYAIEGNAGRLSTVLTTNEWEDPLHTVSAGAAYALNPEWSLLGNFTWGHVAAPLSALTTNLSRPDNETRTKLDLGIRRAWPAFGEVTLTAFGVYQDDAAIYANRTVTGPDGQPVALVENGLARSYGLELDSRTRRFGWGTQLFLNVVAMRTENHITGDWERDREVPEIIIGGGFSHLWRNWELTFLAKHIGSYENDRFLPTGAAPRELADYVNLSAQLAYWFGKERRSKVYFGADNLLDEEYSTVNGYPNDGLFFNGGVSLVF